MEEKKRKKNKKKKNRSGQPDDATAPSTSSETPEVTFSDREPDTCPAAEASGSAPNEPTSVLEESRLNPEDPNFLCTELRQIVQQLTNSLHADAQNSFALCGLLDDIRNAYATSQLNLDHTIELLRGEVLHLNQATSLQKNKEVDLDGDIQHLREEVVQLKMMQEAERERKAAEYVEMQQLREEMIKLNEGSKKQLQMVEEMSDNIQQVLKHGRSTVPTDSCLPKHNSAENAFVEQFSLPPFPQSSKAEAVIDSPVPLHGMTGSKLNGAVILPHFSNVAFSNLETVNGHHVDHVTHSESHINPSSVQIKSIDSDKTAHSLSLLDTFGGQKHGGVRTTEVMSVDSTYTVAKTIQTKPADDHGLFANSTNLVTVSQSGNGENGAHQEISLETISSDLPQPTHLQGTDLKPLSDAPITGAPIRLFRFVARYVSGADLVSNNEN